MWNIVDFAQQLLVLLDQATYGLLYLLLAHGLLFDFSHLIMVLNFLLFIISNHLILSLHYFMIYKSGCTYFKVNTLRVKGLKL